MNTKQALSVLGEFPLSLWNDRAAREAACWGSLRDRAEGLAAGKPVTLAGEIDRTVRYMAIVDGPDGGPATAETDHDHAEYVECTLRMWAQA